MQGPAPGPGLALAAEPERLIALCEALGRLGAQSPGLKFDHMLHSAGMPKSEGVFPLSRFRKAEDRLHEVSPMLKGISFALWGEYESIGKLQQFREDDFISIPVIVPF